jgi:hypothetical protein
MARLAAPPSGEPDEVVAARTSPSFVATDSWPIAVHEIVARRKAAPVPFGSQEPAP